MKNWQAGLIRIFGVLMLSAGVAQAAIHKIEVTVEAQGRTQEEAQQKAVEMAMQQAYLKMLQKLVPDKANEIAGQTAPDQLRRQVRGYEVLQELARENRYVGRFLVTLSDGQVKQEAGLMATGALEKQPAVLVLPVQLEGESTLLWEEANDWRKVWNKVALEKGKGAVVMPFGDPTDVSTVDYTNATQMHFTQLAPMAERYGVKEIVMAIATLDKTTSPPVVKIGLRRLNAAEESVQEYAITAEKPDAKPEEAYKQAAEAMLEPLQLIAQEHAEFAEHVADAKQVAITSQFKRVSDWVNLRQKMQEVPQVVRLDVENISIDSARAKLSYTGDQQQLIEALAMKEILVTPSGDSWSVTLQ